MYAKMHAYYHQKHNYLQYWRCLIGDFYLFMNFYDAFACKTMILTLMVIQFLFLLFIFTLLMSKVFLECAVVELVFKFHEKSYCECLKR